MSSTSDGEKVAELIHKDKSLEESGGRRKII
jgi:hypothetical protein